MTRIALVVSDVDGTLLTKDKTLTDQAARAVRQLEDSGVGFTVVSSRPTIGMVIRSGSTRNRMPMLGRLETTVKPTPLSSSCRTARAAFSVRILSLVSNVPSTSETTRAMRVMKRSCSSRRRRLRYCQLADDISDDGLDGSVD